MAVSTSSSSDPTRTRPAGRFAGVARFVAARLDPKAYLGLHVTVGLGVAALALWLFGALLEEVLDNAAVVRFDVAAHDVGGWPRHAARSTRLRAHHAAR